MAMLTFQKETPAVVATKTVPITSAPSDPAPFGSRALASGELAHLLFDQQDRDRVHESWRKLISGKEFSYRPGLPAVARTALSYHRLRLVNDAVDNAEALASDPRRLASLHEWTGFVDSGLCTLASIHYNLFLGSVLDHDGYRRNLSEFTSMQQTGTFLCTELEHGNDAAALQTTATLDPVTGGFLLHTPTPGARKFMPNTSMTGGPKSALVAARLVIGEQEHGVFLFLVPLSDETGPRPGVTVVPLPERMGSPVDHCLTSFDQVRLPPEALLEAEHGQLAPDGTLSSNVGNRRKRFLRSISRVTTGKLCMSAAAVGASRTALAIAVRYAHSRHISGPKAGEQVPLVAHRSHHARLLHSLATAYAMTFLHRSAVSAWSEHTSADKADAERLVAVAKGWTTWQARTIMIECRERCGAQGLFHVNRLADLQANVEGTITAEGDNLVIWVKAAAEMIFSHQADRHGLSDRPAAERQLTDLDFLRGLLAEVEALWQTRARIAVRQGPFGDPIARWNETSGPALEMVSAHARLKATDAFLAAAEQATDSTARFLLESLCRLFLLQQLREHTGDLLAEGHLAIEHIRELPRAVETVVAELAPHMLTLVDAFDLPDEVLASIPIASGAGVDQYLDRMPDVAEPVHA
ncbi:acyl-CoA dehydrogenase family protein [Streptomyces sp. HUAS TT7]|uniref:acyl-CoA dehydrogenase family protein n=1 Tax=Streptomyces sp. HUAS TT7 TaxID=3447507 RepID=UPI003F660069